MMAKSANRLCLHPLPSDEERRTREIERICRDGYRLLETWQERDGAWYGKFLAPERVA
ncbi:MAG TPA: hypothetical protein VD902_20715 [Symbiobacteriaceae bacterium]|nr:hypothetical protein [Symbiobacteriaceae bacterium]